MKKKEIVIGITIIIVLSIALLVVNLNNPIRQENNITGNFLGIDKFWNWLFKQPPCEDGTKEGKCSITQPLLCKNNELRDNCKKCGCSIGDCNEDRSCGSEVNGKPIYILWLNHFKDHVNVDDDTKVLNDLLDLFEKNNFPVEWTMNGVFLQALRDGVKWPEGHEHLTDEWLIKPNPALIQKLQEARQDGTVFSSFSDTFMPYWAIDKIRRSELKSFDTALELELERNTYYRDPVSNEMDKSRIGGQFEIFTEIFGKGNAYTFHPTPEPQYEYAARIQGSQHFGSDRLEFGRIASEFEGPWYWYMGDMHYTFYAPEMLDGVTHWLPTAGTNHIDKDVSAMKEYVSNSNIKYGAMYAGVHTFALYMQGCMNDGEWDYDNPPNEGCEESPYKPGICDLTSYSIGSFGGNLIDKKYDTSCLKYLNSKGQVPTDWYEMMYNPSTHPSLEVVQEGRREQIYQRNFDYITKFTEKLKQTVDSDTQLIIVTRETAKDLVQDEEGRQINKDTLLQISEFLINNWEKERPSNFIHLKKSSSAADGGSDYFTVAESYRLLHKSLTYYYKNNQLPKTLPNYFVLAPTGLNMKDDIKTEMTGKFSIDDIIQTAVSISPINKYGDYQIDNNIIVNGKEINPAEFLLLIAKANKALHEGKTTDTEIEFVGSKIITPFGSQKGGMACESSWCRYQSWTFKPAKFVG